MQGVICLKGDQMKIPEDELEQVEYWKNKFKTSMFELSNLRLESNPELSLSEIKEDFILEKMATIYVGAVSLGKQVRSLQKQLDEM